MKIHLITWNMHSTRDTLPPLLTGDADLTIISLQEALSMPANFSHSYGYSKEASVGGLRTIVLSRKPMNVTFTTIGLGPLCFPNKGYIITSVNGGILHVNLHLKPHPENQRTRMKQIRSILGAMAGRDPGTILLSGDFNFRMVNGVDQGREFRSTYDFFYESPIQFPPTYKYRKGILDARRTPSYCDRILVASKATVTWHKYNSMDSVISSDHKPVYAVIDVEDNPQGGKLLAVPALNTSLLERLTSLQDFLWRKYVTILLLAVFFVGAALRKR